MLTKKKRREIEIEEVMVNKTWNIGIEMRQGMSN